MGSVAVSNGPRGNISAGNRLNIVNDDINAQFYNPGEGTGGMFRESFEDVRARFLKDMRTPYTAVTAQDYE